MFDPWYESSAIDVGPIGENNELSLDVRTFMKYVSAVKSQKKTSKIFTSDSMCELMVKNTRFNYFDGNNCIGIACGDYASSLILQNIERFVIHPDVGYRVQTTNIVEKPGKSSRVSSKIIEPASYDKKNDVAATTFPSTVSEVGSGTQSSTFDATTGNHGPPTSTADPISESTMDDVPNGRIKSLFSRLDLSQTASSPSTSTANFVRRRRKKIFDGIGNADDNLTDAHGHRVGVTFDPTAISTSTTGDGTAVSSTTVSSTVVSSTATLAASTTASSSATRPTSASTTT
ncbi:hypothetical protein KPH14_013093, partial [Odynerus spinipes]